MTHPAGQGKERIAKVYVFSNGMCMVFNHQGEQMSDYQGRWQDCREKIEADRDADSVIEGAHWGTKAITIMPVEDAEALSFERLGGGENQNPDAVRGGDGAW